MCWYLIIEFVPSDGRDELNNEVPTHESRTRNHARHRAELCPEDADRAPAPDAPRSGARRTARRARQPARLRTRPGGTPGGDPPAHRRSGLVPQAVRTPLDPCAVVHGNGAGWTRGRRRAPLRLSLIHI